MTCPSLLEPAKITQVPSGCWVACVAGLTGLPHDHLAAFVPRDLADRMKAEEEVGQEWTAYHNAVNKYTRSNGWRYSTFGPDIPYGFAIGIGKSPRNLDHAVIVRDGELWWDPHPSREGLVTLTEFEVWTPIRGQLPGREPKL